MFNDFKNLSFDVTKHTIQKLKDIFDRLNLSDLERRYINLNNKLISLDNQTKSLSEYTNEHYPPPPPPPPPPTEFLPDLAIINIVPTTYTNYVNFEIEIQNVGIAISPSTTLSENLIGGGLSNSVAVPSLAPGGSFTTNVQYSFDPSGATETKTFSAEVNPSHSFNEVSFGNNGMMIPVQVKTAYSDPYDPYDPDGIYHTYIIFHAHNSEGKEVGSVGGGRALFNYTNGAKASPTFFNQHATRQNVIPGTYSCTATWNGMVVNLGLITFNPYSTTSIIVTFPRTQINSSSLYPSIINVGGKTSSYYTEGTQQPNTVLYMSSYPSGFSPYSDITAVWDFSFSIMSYNYNLTLSIGDGFQGYFSYVIGQIPISYIPATTDFTVWFVQSNHSGYPGMKLAYYSTPPPFFFSPPDYSYFFVDADPGIHQNIIPASLAYNMLISDSHGGVGIYDDYIWYLITNFTNVIPETITGSKSILSLIISSVPYDLAGTGW
jgi:hypothetical protein